MESKRVISLCNHIFRGLVVLLLLAIFIAALHIANNIGNIDDKYVLTRSDLNEVVEQQFMLQEWKWNVFTDF